MISETIKKSERPIEERGVPKDSYFSIVFADESEISEKEISWSSICEQKEVNSLNGKKVVNISKHPVKLIKCYHEGMEAQIEVPEGCEAYQAIRSETVIIPSVQRNDRILGRVIGIVKDGEIIEEHFLNSVEFRVQGFRK
jgi:hypothetical protein